jgi:leucyl/phenylalanyl-tRNA---protein transferase
MFLHVLDEELWFPPVEDALDDGLLAIGGDLSTERLLLAYRNGIFPWFDEDVPMWWCPDPRFVLYPGKLKVSKSMQQLLKRDAFEFTTDTAFEQVIANCKHTPRKDQDGTWITDEVKAAYTELHRLGYAHSAEAWQDGKLVGGLYGIRMGSVFFGESMFSHASNASKYAFIKYMQQLRDEGVEMVDCQVYTEHLESLGAEMIPRSLFLHQLQLLLNKY